MTRLADNDGYGSAYGYAPDGTRIRAQESNHANPDRWFQYDGVRPVLEGTLSGNTFTTVNRYVLEGESYYDPLAFAQIGGAWRYYLYDGLGSTRQLIDSNQTVTDTYSYEAFGNVMASTGTTANPYRYVGSLGYYQTGSSLMHLGARYYMPEIGRFTSRDSVPRGATFEYHYAEGNPTYYTDPTGESIVPPLPMSPWLDPGVPPKMVYPPGVKRSHQVCKPYLGCGMRGWVLYNMCLRTPNGPWSNCVRKYLLGQWMPAPECRYRHGGIRDHMDAYKYCLPRCVPEESRRA